MTELGVHDITVRFGATTVLDGVSLQVADGEIVALLGPSGSGKSTLLRVVAGITPPDAGRVTLDSVDVTAVPTHRRRVGMVFQDNQLFPHRSVRDNVAFGLQVTGRSKPQRRAIADAWLARVGLDGIGARRTTSLSGGEAKRVALARSLAAEPAVLLLDEPLTGLDRELHDRLADELANVLRASATTTLLVTHDQEEAATVADRVVELASLGSGAGHSPPTVG
jgi:thiamine transport system ATP-binding protein